MRRKEREVTEIDKIDEIIQSCNCCRIGLIDGDVPYIVPLNFGYERLHGQAIFYFHGAKEGKKIDLIQKNHRAGFELDTKLELVTSDQAQGHSFKYQSVIGSGDISLIADMQEKKHALSLLMLQYTKRSDWKLNETILQNMSVIKLKVEKLTCKQHL